MTASLHEWKTRIDHQRALLRKRRKTIQPSTLRTPIHHRIAFKRDGLAFVGDRQVKPNQAGIIPAHFSEF